ncbi:hypothetical protein ACFPTY_05690 [Halomonas beimenensis]|uniref:Uncharacterized protein n=1 Tax=Halomonas beimenensis TaxID=475662 RepID=A0A291P6G2_9GAMM|nr:hypothetical protein [Halomonas beimenensis]ATJ82467.1 hypothetical protein BEI_1480 [Halomonas beimenensis]
MAAGCSYTPARLHTGPLIEIGDYPHRHHRHRHHDHHDRWWHHNGHEERRWDHRSRDRRRHHHRDRHHRSRFCPPGLARQGRC